MSSDRRLIVIDGYNLIHRTPLLRPGADRTLREARDKLVNLLAWGIGAGEAQFVVVFDGAEGVQADERHARIDVRFSRPPQKADDLIRSIVEERVEADERVTVVTSDLEVARHPRAMGAAIALADLFLASTLDPAASATPEKPETLTRKELEEWAEIFRARRTPAPSDEDDV